MESGARFAQINQVVGEIIVSAKKNKVSSLQTDLPSSANNDAHHDEAGEIATVVSQNLKKLRIRRGLSLEVLAKLAGVSRAMLSQIEIGRSVPTISLLWKVARALDVPFAALTSNGDLSGTVLMPVEKAKTLSSAGGEFTSRALFPFGAERRVEFYKLTLAAAGVEMADPHPPGTVENLFVASGQVEITTANVTYTLKTEDGILFEADVPHVYRNLGNDVAVMFLVMTYASAVG